MVIYYLHVIVPRVYKNGLGLPVNYDNGTHGILLCHFSAVWNRVNSSA